LYYLRARYYNPVTGRFLSVDPEAGEGQRRYEYAGADPVNGLDPTGNEAIIEFALINNYPGRLGFISVHFPTWCGFAGSEALSECGAPGPGGPPQPPQNEVTVSFWPKAACFVGICRGHVGIGVNTDDTHGFYPKMFAFLSPLTNVPGVVWDDANHQAGGTAQLLHHKSNPNSNELMQLAINIRAYVPGSYNLFDRNCVQFDVDVLRAGEIDPSSSTQAPMVDPSQWFNTLKQMHGWY